MSAVRSGPFAWSSFGAGYLVASYDDGGSLVIDVVLPEPADGDDSLRWAAALPPADATRLAAELAALAGAERPMLAVLPDLGERLADVDAALRAWDPATESAEVAGSSGPPGTEAALDAVDDLLQRLFELRGELAEAIQAGPSAVARTAAGRGDPKTVMTGPGRAVAPDRKLTTMGGLALALGIVAVFWIGLGVLLWMWLR